MFATRALAIAGSTGAPLLDPGLTFVVPILRKSLPRLPALRRCSPLVHPSLLVHQFPSETGSTAIAIAS